MSVEISAGVLLAKGFARVPGRTSVQRPRGLTGRWQVSVYGPLIDRTHQAWKLHLATIAVAAAIVIHVIARLFVPGITGRELAACSGASAVVAASGLFIFFRSVRCPDCGAHWIWRAVKDRSGRWLEWLHEQQVCPVCGSAGGLPSKRSSEGS